jgi:hypothetical protein
MGWRFYKLLAAGYAVDQNIGKAPEHQTENARKQRHKPRRQNGERLNIHTGSVSMRGKPRRVAGLAEGLVLLFA